MERTIKDSRNESIEILEDPGQLLISWLGELDSLKKSTGNEFMIPNQYNSTNTTTTGINTSTSSNKLIRRMSSSQSDSERLEPYRYSLVNLEETLDQDLDSILGELCLLDSHLGNVSNSKIEPTYITAESVRLNKVKNFCVTNSKSSEDPLYNSCISTPLNDDKSEKIRLAMKRIAEASIKKIFIKVFSDDGSSKSLLVDERMTVSKVSSLLAERNTIKRNTQIGLVELLPDLHMERAYEDHEYLVENLLMWKADSKNTLWFIRRPEVYDLFVRPELYLLGQTSSQMGSPMEDSDRKELLREYFSSSGIGAPEVEGFLFLKSENKKKWKKYYFVLRTSGLYYAPKGKKSSKDLICLSTFDVNQVYFGVKWQPKFKSPSKHCFAIKHPQIQTKNPKYIRYLCTDTEEDLNRWVTGIRLAKYGVSLLDNYKSIQEEERTLSGTLNGINTDVEVEEEESKIKNVRFTELNCAETLSPQPKRPAPVLTPLLKPSSSSLYSGFLQERKKPPPTYEETLLKCQSLTRSLSFPTSSSSESGETGRSSGRGDEIISHLPPSGVSSFLGRSSHVTFSRLQENDAHQTKESFFNNNHKNINNINTHNTHKVSYLITK